MTVKQTRPAQAYHRPSRESAQTSCWVSIVAGVYSCQFQSALETAGPCHVQYCFNPLGAILEPPILHVTTPNNVDDCHPK